MYTNRIACWLPLLVTGLFCSGQQKFVPREPLASRIETPRPVSEPATPALDMVAVQSAAGTFYIDRYEASETAPGDFFSARNQEPRVRISAKDAARECAAQGKRLCTYHEWKDACLGIRRNRFSYGKTFREKACNLDAKGLLPTGRKRECRTDTGLHDMVGNAMEWVSDTRRGRSLAVGGSFATGEGSDCFTAHYFTPETRNGQIGFRCCL